jgi:transposase-like protein
MKRKFTTSFKIQAVEKALSRNENTTLIEIANSLSIGASTLSNWIVKAKNQEFETASYDEITSMSNDKRPQDWTLEERLNMVVACASLSDEELNEHCRSQGLYPHHIKQWKLDFINGNAPKKKAVSPSEIKTLKHENKSLKKELNRKDKALAETAALLVLKKKVHEIWGNDEDN